MFYCILFIAFFALMLVISLFSSSNKSFDWQQNLRTILIGIAFFLFQMVFVIAVDFIAIKEELQVLNTIYTAVRSIDMMDKEKFLTMIRSSTRPCIVKRLPNLFIRLGSRITFSYDIGIYQLTNLFMFLELKKEEGLQQIIEFFESNQGKTIIALSSIFPIRNYQKMYLLWIFAPKNLVKKVRSYIIEQEKERYKIHSSMILKHRKYNNKSLLQYSSNKGWKQHSLLEYDQLCKKLRKKNSNVTASIVEGVYLSAFKGSDWNYQQYTKPADLIKQYLTGLPSFNLKDLPWKETKKHIHTQRINNNKKIQRKMIIEMAHQGELKLNFDNWKFFSQYSLDQYLLITPSLTTQQVEALAEYLPHFYVYETTEGKYLINGNMHHRMVNELRRELGWRGYEIMLYYWGMPKTLEMYDFEKMEWKIPQVLEGY